MKELEYVHHQACPSYVVDRGSHNCTCDRLWEIQGLERIEAYLEHLFKTADEPTLFKWAAVVNDFNCEDEDEELPELEEE